MADAPIPNTSRAHSRLRGLIFRLLAVLIGLSPLLLAEGILRAFGVGRATDYNDPFVGFSDIHPLFVLDDDQERYHIPKSRYTHFRPESFLADKPADEFRIFVLGGSTVQGEPYVIETSFTTWLELSLRAASPDRRWEVVNCGGTSYASYRLVPILCEVLSYQPNLIIVCTGHNEFLEDRSYGHLKTAPPVLSWMQRQFLSLRTFNVLRGGWLSLTQKEQVDERSRLGPESDAMLDWKGGMARYHRDAKWQQGVIAHFANNLERMVAICKDAGVPLLLISEVSNLAWPPFKPEHREDITQEQRAQFATLLERAQQQCPPQEALALLSQARAIDDQHALVHYSIGQVLLHDRSTNEARAALIRAKDLDVCPLRMLEPMKDILQAVARSTDTPLLDAEELIVAKSNSGLPDNQWLIDHVHPTVEGHQLIAGALVQKMAELGYVHLSPGWEAEQRRLYAENLKSLNPAYFSRGQLRLQAVQRWARGMATLQPSDDRPKP